MSLVNGKENQHKFLMVNTRIKIIIKLGLRVGLIVDSS